VDINDLETIALNNPTQFLIGAEVAEIFRVDPKTVTRWVKAGRIRSIKTLGGHHRFQAGEVYKAMMREQS